MNKKGFTIIELLVVIAIIAVLAAIVLVNVTQYISKGKDAAIKGNLDSIRTNAAVYYDSHSNYTNFFTDPTYTNPKTAIASANPGGTITPTLGSSDSAYCVAATLNAGGSWCVDSTGFSGAATCASGACSTSATPTPTPT